MADKEKLLLVSSKESISIKNDGGEVNLLINGKAYVFDPPEKYPSAEDKISFAHELKRSFYKNFLSNHFENLVVLSGAGTSVGWGGKTMKELWDAVKNKLIGNTLEKLCKAIGFISETTDFANLKEEEKDLEKLLSRANIAKEFIKKYRYKTAGGEEKEEDIDITDLVSKAESEIQKECRLVLQDKAPHEQFLNKITNRKLKDPRVKLFTLNYDTLFEQAAVKGNFTIVDGFSFSNPRTLSGRNFDYDIVYREKSRIKEEESFIPKVFHLYKPHGSVNWELNKSNNNIVINDATTEPLMIYPKDSKYENSYEQPFFEMMSRFQQNLRNNNVLLVCVGFSFSDKHIVTAIKEAVTQNPSFRLLIIARTIRESDVMNWFIEKAKSQYNIIIVSEEFKDFSEHYPISQIYSDSLPIINLTPDAKTV